MMRSHLLIVFLACGLLACQKNVLLNDLEQRDGNEILVLLAQNGISADKEAITAQQKTTWTLYVSSRDEQRARELLVHHHLPKSRELGLEGICKESGMIPTPKTEKCRELLAIKGEIINSLRSIPSVVSADVVINIPDKEEFPDPNAPQPRPTASVIVQVKPMVGVDELTEAQIQRFVANAITGMDLRDVAVIIGRLNPPAVIRVDGVSVVDSDVAQDAEITDEEPDQIPEEASETAVTKFRTVVILFLIFFILISGALIILLIRMARMRQKGTGAKVGAVGMPNPALPERTQMDQIVEEAGKHR